MKTEVALWRGPTGLKIPTTASSAEAIVPYAATLKPAEQQKVIKAVQSGFHAMGAEYVWRRSMTLLRSTMSNLGNEFIAEMTKREDVATASSLEQYLTDYETIRLAEALGVVNPTGAMRLRHASEILTHFAEGKADDDELPALEAVGIIRTCVQYALGEEDIGVAVDFFTFRNRLLSESLTSADGQVEQFVNQPPFFLSTALRVLLAAIRRDTGARQQHALGNFAVLLPLIWPRLPEAERWSVGELYAEASAAGQTAVILDLKRTLQKVRGFDYVPESLRSTTFKRAAQAVITTHFSYNNFHHEEAVVQQLASLGTVIPKPAVADCIRAYLCVYLGNKWGISFSAAPTAAAELGNVPATYWEYYFTDVFKDDDIVLEKLIDDAPRSRFMSLVAKLTIPAAATYPKDVAKLVEAARKDKPAIVRDLATRLLAKYKPM